MLLAGNVSIEHARRIVAAIGEVRRRACFLIGNLLYQRLGDDVTRDAFSRWSTAAT